MRVVQKAAPDKAAPHKAAPGDEVVERGILSGIRSSIAGISFNFFLAALKCVAGIAGHSFVLLADGIESFSDVVTSAIIYMGLRFAIKPPDADHPYGHGKADPIAAVMVGVAMMLAGLGIAWESVVLIRTPHPLPRIYTLGVVLLAVALKMLLSRYVGVVNRAIESTALRSEAWHHLSDATISGVAFLGIAVALWTRNPTADDWAALCVSPVIVLGGWRQLRRPFAELLDTAPPPEVEQKVRGAARDVALVLGLEKCFVRKVGFRYYVDLHVVVAGDLTVREGHRIAHEVANQVRQRVSRVAEVLVHIEPEEELLRLKR